MLIHFAHHSLSAGPVSIARIEMGEGRGSHPAQYRIAVIREERRSSACYQLMFVLVLGHEEGYSCEQSSAAASTWTCKSLSIVKVYP